MSENVNESPADLLERLGDDGMKWADEFRRTAISLGYSDMPIDWLVGWFACAIEHSTLVRSHHLASQPKPEQAVGDGMAMQRVIDAALALISDAEEVETADGLANVAQLYLWHALEDAVEKVGPADISNFTPRPAVSTPAEVTVEDVDRALGHFYNKGYLSTHVEVEGERQKMRDALEEFAALTAQCRVRKDTQGLDDSGRLTPVVTDEAVERACSAYYNSGVPVQPPVFEGMRAALESAAPTSPSAGAVVPDRITADDAKKRRYLRDPIAYADGWNACCESMLAAAPEVPRG